MNTKIVIKLAASAFLLGGTMIAADAGFLGGSATASDSGKAQRSARGFALKAQKALAARDNAKAVGFAEQAVEAAPRDAGYRALLGQSYLQAGRLVAAETAFTDAVSLYPEDGRSTLSLALVKIALGNPQAGLDITNGSRVPVSAADRGLILALVGDVQGAIAVLELAAREQNATPKVRQNLALSYALAGMWSESRAVAAQDVPADQLDRRMLSWAGFASPRNSWDQVASLLGIKPVLDRGQPERLALAPLPSDVRTAEADPAPERSVEVALAAEPAAPLAEVAMAEPVQEPAPEALQEPGIAPAPAMLAAAPEPAPAPAAQPGAMLRQVVFSPRREVVQPFTASFRPSARPSNPKYVPVIASRAAPVRGGYVVQFGAFSSAAKAESAWNRTAGRFGLTGYTPDGTVYRQGKATFHRVSAGGFATRQEAMRVCASVKAKGGNCFVRGATTGAPALWTQRAMSTRLAAR